MRKFYRQRLNLATRDIQTMDWCAYLVAAP